jgi:hypothetical protein
MDVDTMSAVSDILLGAALLALTLLLLGALLFGMLALIAPTLALRLQQRSALQFSTRRRLKWAEWPHQIEREFYRHHRWFGLALLLVGGASLWVLLSVLEPATLLRALAANSAHRLWLDVVITTLRLLLIAGLGFAMLVSLVVIIRPSLLKRTEAKTNRWVSSRQALRQLEQDKHLLNRQFERQPRVLGLLVVVSAGALLVLLWPITQYLLGH